MTFVNILIWKQKSTWKSFCMYFSVFEPFSPKFYLCKNVLLIYLSSYQILTPVHGPSAVFRNRNTQSQVSLNLTSDSAKQVEFS